MNAAPLLAEVARTLDDVKLDAVLIGNAAAALQGAPVTTIDFDFFFQNSSRNVSKLKMFASAFAPRSCAPIYPASNLYRVVRDEDGLQVDFMVTIHGIRSYEGIRDRSSTVEFSGAALRVASLADIIKSKRAAGRPRDLAVLEVLETALEEAREPATPPRRRGPRKPT